MAEFKEVKKTLDSGAEFLMQSGSWEEAHRLYKAVMEVIGKFSFADGEVMALFAGLSTSDAVEAAIWKCLARCTYNGQRITKQTFEDEKAREDFLVVAKEVMVLNLSPFITSLAFVMPKTAEIVKKAAESQAQT